MTKPGVTGDTVPYWHDDTDTSSHEAWDTLWLGGERWPGIATISGEVGRKIQVKKSPGKDGATIKDEGYEPAKLSITLQVWDADGWSELNRLLPLIHPRRKGAVRDPLAIEHAQTRYLGIKSVYIDKIPMPELDKTTGLLTQSISAIEYYSASVDSAGQGSGTRGSGGSSGVVEAVKKAFSDAKDTIVSGASIVSGIFGDDDADDQSFI